MIMAPWAENWPHLAAQMKIHASVDEAERFMVEFIGQGSGIDALPVSTVILSSDFKDHSKGAAQRSSVYQELLAIRSTGSHNPPTWTLIDIAEIGKYLDRLEVQAIEYVDEEPIKAVKRCFSLAATMGLEELGDEALEILLLPESDNYVTLKRKIELIEKFHQCGENEQKFIREHFRGLETEREHIKVDFKEEFPALFARCKDFVDRLKAELQTLDTEISKA